MYQYVDKIGDDCWISDEQERRVWIPEALCDR